LLSNLFEKDFSSRLANLLRNRSDILGIGVIRNLRSEQVQNHYFLKLIEVSVEEIFYLRVYEY